MKKEIDVGYNGAFNKYYPSYITKDKNGRYGIFCPKLSIAKSGLISGKEIFDKIGIPEFDLCEWQDDYVLQKLQKSIYLDILNEAFDFKNEPWAEAEEKTFQSKEYYIDGRDFSNIFDSRWLAQRLFLPDSKYIDAPYFYLANWGHICLDAHCLRDEDSINPQKKIEAYSRMWSRATGKSHALITAELLENDVLMVSKRTKTLFRIDDLFYFCILPIVNLTSGTIRYIEFNFSLIYHKYNKDINRNSINGTGNVTQEIERLENEFDRDLIGIITKNRSEDAFIKLSNRVKKQIETHPDSQIYTIYQFSYDFATADEIRKVKEILDKK